MKKYDNKDKLDKTYFDILNISARAKECKNEVIDGSIGVMLNEEHKLENFSFVAEALKDPHLYSFGYGAIQGPKSLKSTLPLWVFGADLLSYIHKNYDEHFTATLGGTGALFLYTHLLKKREGECDVYTLTPSWPNYENIIKGAGLHFKTINLFNSESQFNYEGIGEIIKNSFKPIGLILNDPANNPTGFSLSLLDYSRLADLFETLEQDLYLMIDLAYLDYASKERFRLGINMLFQVLNPHFHLSFAISLSKSFGLYGLRTGAYYELVSPSNKEQLENYDEFINSLIRATYSSPSTFGFKLLETIFNFKNQEQLEREIQIRIKMLEKRAQLFMKLLKEASIDFLPYHAGFFITIRLKSDSFKLAKLFEEKNLYLVPLKGNLMRVSLASLSINELPQVIDIIKGAK